MLWLVEAAVGDALLTTCHWRNAALLHCLRLSGAVAVMSAAVLLLTPALAHSDDEAKIQTETNQKEAAAHAPPAAASKALSDPTDFENRPQSLLSELGEIQSIDISADGRHIATGGGRQDSPGRVTLWNATSRDPLATWDSPSGVKSVAFSPDGKRLASVGWDRSLVVRRVPAGELLFEFPIGTSAARLAWSSDGRLLATAAEGVGSNAQLQMAGVKLWDADTGKELATLEGDIVRYSDVAFSPDGKLLAAAGGTGLNGNGPLGQINLWNVERRRQTAVFKNDDYVYGVSFSPDGSLLASGSARQAAKLWDVKSGDVKASLVGHASGVGRPAFSPSGELLATPGHDGIVKLWSVAEGRELATLRGHEKAVRVAEFSPDGKMLTTGGVDSHLRWWDVVSREPIDAASSATAALPAVLALAQSPDGRLLAAACEDRTVRLLDAQQGQSLRRLEDFDDVVASLDFSPDGQLLATGSFDHTVRLWNAQSGAEVRQFEGHTNWVYAVAFSPDGKLLASGGYDKTIRLWEAATGKPVATLKGHTAAVRALEFSPDGKRLASGSADRSVVIWSVAEEKALATIKEHEGAIRAVVFSPDGKTLASAAEDKTVRLWNADTGAALHKLEGHEEMVWCLAYTHSGRTLASGSFDGKIKLWNPETGAERATLSGHEDAVTSLLLAPDSGALVSGSYDRTVKVWSPKLPPVPPMLTISQDPPPVSVVFSPNGKQLAYSGGKLITLCGIDGNARRTLAGHELNVFRVVFSPDGESLASGSFDKSVRLWNVRTGRQIAKLEGHPAEVRSLDFSSDGRRLATSCWGGVVVIWDVESKRQLLRLPTQSLPVTCVEFSPDDRLLLTSSGNWREWQTPGELKLWDAKTGEVVALLPGHDVEVKRACFSPDGRWIAASVRMRVKVWDVATRTLHAEIKTSSASNALIFLKQQNLLAAGGMDGSVVVWDVATSRIMTRCEDHNAFVFSLDASPDGSLLASASNDTTIKLWRLDAVQQRAAATGEQTANPE